MGASICMSIILLMRLSHKMFQFIVFVMLRGNCLHKRRYSKRKGFDVKEVDTSIFGGFNDEILIYKYN